MDLALTFLNGEHATRSFDFQAPCVVTLGRSPACDIVFADSRISRQHCRIELDAHRALVTDLDSANGTFVNGAVVGTSPLAHGDRLKLCEVDVAVSVADHEKTARADSSKSSIVSTARFNSGALVEIKGYQVVRCLGEGAFGAVFEACGENGEPVAIKVAKIRGDCSAHDRRRFLQEATTAAALVHPNVVRVIDHGESRSALYIVLEFVRGETLRALIDRTGPLPVMTALVIARQIASALEAARLAKIVHRDVKPDNILLREDGMAKLADFGFAKCLLQESGQSGLTHHGEVLGTIAYMSPEQLGSSLTADHRSDLYSFGATLYHALAGSTPFSARSNMDYFAKILAQPPLALDRIRGDVPPIVSRIVARCLAKNPDERYQTAGDIVRRLNQLLATTDSRPTVSRVAPEMRVG